MQQSSNVSAICLKGLTPAVTPYRPIMTASSCCCCCCCTSLLPYLLQYLEKNGWSLAAAEQVLHSHQEARGYRMQSAVSK